jgi:hypothetical protein
MINIAGLSLGLTCCMLIVLYTKDEVSFDRFQAHKDQLYRITVKTTDERETRTMGNTNAIHGPTVLRLKFRRSRKSCGRRVICLLLKKALIC